jgi:hypothetical protein
MSLIHLYWKTVKEVLTRPRSFFRNLPSQGGMSTPLAFALVTHWISSVLGYLWSLQFRSISSSWLEQILSEVSDDIDYSGKSAFMDQTKHILSEWFSGLGAVILDPFLVLVNILVSAFFVYIAARIFVTPGRHDRPEVIRYEAAVKIISYGLTPSVLIGVPLIGSMLSAIYTFFLTIIGVSAYYRVSTLRGMLIYLFPKVIIFGIIALGSLAFLTLLAVIGFLI